MRVVDHGFIGNERLFNRLVDVLLAEGLRRGGEDRDFGDTRADRALEPGAVWDEPTLDAFFKRPSGFVEGTNMMTPPVYKNTERADLIAFLKSKK